MTGLHKSILGLACGRLANGVFAQGVCTSDGLRVRSGWGSSSQQLGSLAESKKLSRGRQGMGRGGGPRALY